VLNIILKGMKHKKLIITVATSLLVLPLFAFGASSGSSGSADGLFADTSNLNSYSAASNSSYNCSPQKTLMGLFDQALCILDRYVVPFLIGLGLVLFLLGVLNYVRSGDNEEKRQAGRDLMWFGIVSLFIMIGVWGFVNLLFNTFFGQDSQFSSLPKQSQSVFAE
jgi:predicted permease